MMITNQFSHIEEMRVHAQKHIFERKTPWAVRLFNQMKDKAKPWLNLSNEDIRRLVPASGSYYAYGLDVLCPIDRAPLDGIRWNQPGQVGCRHGHQYPDVQYPDTGEGYRAADGKMHYFSARWNGFVMTELTQLLKPLSYLYLITEEQTYADKALVILDAIAAVYPAAIHGPLDYPGLAMDKEGGRLERPQYQAARHLMLYAEAYSILQRFGPIDECSATNKERTVRDHIKRNILENCGDYCMRESRKDIYWPLNNGTADYNMGILAVGILCDIPEYVEWVLHGRSSILNMLANAVDDEGSYFETSLNYTIATQLIYKRFAEMLYHYRHELYPEGVNLYDHTKFRAFMGEFKRKNSIANRLPRYGDTEVDTMEGDKDSKLFDAEDFVHVMMLAVRTKEVEYRQHCFHILGEMNLVGEELAGDSVNPDSLYWLLFHTLPEHFEWDPRQEPSLSADVLTGKGLAFLRYGKGKHARGLFMRYGATLNHGHLDELGLLIYDQGKEWSFDPGYYNSHNSDALPYTCDNNHCHRLCPTHHVWPHQRGTRRPAPPASGWQQEVSTAHPVVAP